MAEEDYIDFHCPYCGETASFPASCAGTVQSCPHCPENVLVPRASAEVGGKLPISVATRQLLLRRLKPADWKELREFMSDPETLRYLEWEPMSEEEIERWIELDKAVQLMQPGQSFHLAIELTEGAKVIGLATLSPFDRNQQAAIELIVNPNFRRKGYGAEAAGALIDFSFRGLNLRRLTANCDSRNKAAARMLEKAGFRREGESVKEFCVKGEWINTAKYALLHEEYETWNEAQKASILNT